MRAACRVCPHHCRLKEGETGLCRARKNVGGQIVSLIYISGYAAMHESVRQENEQRFLAGCGKITGLALDRWCECKKRVPELDRRCESEKRVPELDRWCDCKKRVPELDCWYESEKRVPALKSWCV